MKILRGVSQLPGCALAVLLSLAASQPLPAKAGGVTVRVAQEIATPAQAWLQPDFFFSLTPFGGLLLPLSPVNRASLAPRPQVSTYGALVDGYYNLSGRWGLGLTLRYGFFNAGDQGIGLTGQLLFGPVWRLWRQLRVSAQVGVALEQPLAERVEALWTPALQQQLKDRLASANIDFADVQSSARQTQLLGPALGLAVSYLFPIGHLFATGPSLRLGWQLLSGARISKIKGKGSADLNAAQVPKDYDYRGINEASFVRQRMFVADFQYTLGWQLSWR